jgi:MFS family permease
VANAHERDIPQRLAEQEEGFEMVLWMTTISVSVALLVVTAAMGLSMPTLALVYFLIAGMVSSVMAILALREAREMAESGATRGLVAAGLTRHMGLLWAWAALVTAITYGTGILSWSPWWQYFLSFMVFSGLCLFVSKVITEDQLAGRPDDKMQRVCLGLAAQPCLSSSWRSVPSALRVSRAISLTKRAPGRRTTCSSSAAWPSRLSPVSCSRRHPPPHQTLSRPTGPDCFT